MDDAGTAPPAPAPADRGGPSVLSLKQRLMRGGAWVVGGKVVTAVSTIVIASVLSRLLPQEQVGVYFLAERLIWLLAFVALLGMNSASVRLIAEAMGTGRPGRARSVVRFVYAATTMAALAVAACLYAGAGAWIARVVYDSPLLAVVMPIAAIWVAVHTLQVLTSEVFRGFQDLRFATIFGGVVTGALTLAGLAAVWIAGMPIDVRRVFLIFAGAAGTSLVLALLVLRRRIVTLGPREPLESREVFPIALPLWINGLLAWSLTQCDVLILGAWQGDAEVAVYGAAAKLVTLVLMSLMLVNLVVPPFIAELYATGQRERLERMLRLTATIAGIPAFAALGLYLLLGPWVLGVVYGPEYRGGATVLALLSVGRLVTVCTGSAGFVLSMTGHQRALLRITVVTSVVTVLAALAAVRPFGATGVAAAVATGVAGQAIWVWLTARACTGVWTHVGIRGLREALASGLRSKA